MAATPWQESIEFWKAKYEAEERARRGAEAQLAEGRSRAAGLEAGAAEAAQRWEAMRGFQAALLGLRDRVDTLPFSALPAPEKLKLKQQIADLRRLLRHLPVAAGDGPGAEPPGASEEDGRTDVGALRARLEREQADFAAMVFEFEARESQAEWLETRCAGLIQGWTEAEAKARVMWDRLAHLEALAARAALTV